MEIDYTKEAVQVIADRFSEQQILKAQDILADLRDALNGLNFTEDAEACQMVFKLLADAINLDA